MATKKAAKVADEIEEEDVNTGTQKEAAPENPRAQAREKEKEEREKDTPIAKPKKSLVKPHISDLYPWALNRRKAESAHNAVIAAHGEDAKDFAQKVMDEYTAHGGLVSGQEGVTLVGRRGPTKKRFKPGKTTSEVLGRDVDEEDEE